MSPRPWYREPMLALVIGLPLTAVVAAIGTLVIAARGPGDAMDHAVRRVAQVQTTDLAPDRKAARQGLAATAVIDDAGAIRLQLRAAAPLPADILLLTLRHATDPRRDRSAALAHLGGADYAGRLPAPRSPGAHNAVLEPADGNWRLVGRLAEGDQRINLQPALGD